MTEELKSLIEKIQVEGVQAAEEKARQIEEEARQQASRIIEEAKAEAEKIILEARERIANNEEASRLALKQSGRDTLIALKKEINSLLDKIMRAAIQEALSPQELGKIIAGLIKELSHKQTERVEITLKKEDSEKIEKAFFSELKDEIKKGITLKAQEEISGGFLISFDAGKSHFDFTDKALVDYLAVYLKPKLLELLK